MVAGENLRYLLASRGVTTRWLSTHLGIEARDLDAWCEGAALPPETAERLARLLGQPIDASMDPPADAPEHHLRGLRDVFRRRRRGSRSHARL